MEYLKDVKTNTDELVLVDSIVSDDELTIYPTNGL